MKKPLCIAAIILLYIISLYNAGQEICFIGSCDYEGPDFVCIVAALISSTLLFLPILKKVSNSTESLVYKIIYIFISNLGIFCLTMLIWIVSGGITEKKYGFERILDKVQYAIPFSIIGIIVYFVTRKDKNYIKIDRRHYTAYLLIFLSVIAFLLALSIK